MTADLLCGVLIAGGLVLVMVTVAAVRIAMIETQRAHELRRDLNRAYTDLARERAALHAIRGTWRAPDHPAPPIARIIPFPRTPTHDMED